MGARQWAVIALCAACQPPVEVPVGTDTGVVPLCPPSETLAGPFTDTVLNLVAKGDQVLWVQREGPSFPTVVNAIRTDGTGLTEVHRSGSGRSVVSLAFAGERVVFLETEARNGPSALFVTDIGGAPKRTAVRSWSGDPRLIGATESHGFVVFEDGDHVVVDGVELDTGAPGEVGIAKGVDAPHHLALDGVDLYFRAGALGGTSVPALYRLSTEARNRAAEVVGTIGHDRECNWPVGGFAVTPGSLVCGLGPVYAYPRASGEGPLEILTREPGGDHVVIGADGETVFTVGTSDSTFDVPVTAVQADGSDPVVLACDARKVLPQTVSAAYPDRASLQAVVTGDSVVWLDEARGRLAGVDTVTLRRAAR